MKFDDRFFFGSGKRYRCKHGRHDQRSELKLGVCPDPYCEKYVEDKLIEHIFSTSDESNYTLFSNRTKDRLTLNDYTIVIWKSIEYRDGNHTWWVWEKGP